MNKEPRTINYRAFWMLVVACCVVLLSAPASGQDSLWQKYLADGVKAYEEGRYADAEKSLKDALKEALDFGDQDPRLGTSLYSLAVLYNRFQGKYAEAEQLLKEALKIQEKTLGPDHLSLGYSLFELGIVYFSQGKVADSEPLYKRALPILEKALGSEHLDVALTLNNLGLVYLAQRRYTEGEPLISKALPILEKALGPENAIVGLSLTSLGEMYRIQGKYAEAESLLKQALAVQEKVLGPEHLGIAHILYNLALVYYPQGKYTEAEPVLKRALPILEKALGPEHLDVAYILNNLGLVYLAQRRYSEGEPLISKALPILEKALGPENSIVGFSLASLGDLYRVQGKFGEAERLLHRALPILEKALGSQHLVVVILKASLYMSRGEFAEAEPLVRRALAIGKEKIGPEHTSILAGLVSTMAQMYMLRDNFAEAEPLYRQALTIREKALGPEDSYLAQSLHDLGLVYMAQGKFAEAKPLYNQALKIQEKTLGPDHPDVLLWKVSLYISEGRYSQAETFLKRALAIRERAQEHPVVALTLRNLARALVLRSQWTLARTLFEHARRIHLGMLRTAIDERVHEGFLKAGKSGLRAYAETLAAIARDPRINTKPVSAEEHAFVVVEQVHGGLAQIALTKAASRQATRDPVTSDLARKVQDLSNHRREVSEQLTHEYEKPTVVTRFRVLQDAMRQLDRELNEALDRLTKAFPNYTDLIVPEPARVETVQKMLRSDEALVSFFTLDDRLLIWLIRSDKELVYRDIELKREDLAELVARVRVSLDQSRNSKLAAGLLEPVDVDGAHRLYKVLFGPIRDHLDGVKHLIVVPDELLLPLPFGTLLTRAEGEPYKTLSALHAKKLYPDNKKLAEYGKLPWLVREMAITVLPSATSLRALRQVRKTKRRAEEPFIGFGDPLLYGSGNGRGAEMLETRGMSVPLDKLRKLPRLPGTRQELLAVAKALGADPSKSVYLGEYATELMVSSLNASGRLGNSEVVAFATHALIAGQIAGLKQPALVLTPPNKPSEEDDGLLDLEDIFRLKLDNADWVILSACNTALENGTGEGLSGSVRAFFFAGARSLLVSHWSIDDRATQTLMTEVFSRYANGKRMPRSEALRQGMLAIMAKAKGETAYFAHPFAWAPLFLVGEGSTPVN